MSDLTYRGRPLRMVDRACDLCGSRNHRLVGRKQGKLTGFLFCIVRCSRCGFVFVNPGLDDASLLSLYDEDYYFGRGFDPWASYLSETGGIQDHPCYRSEDIAASIDGVARTTGIEGRDVLDIGSGLGGLIKALSALGYNVLGIETSQFAVKLCQEAGLDVAEGPLSQAVLTTEKFDVVTLIETIEHIPDPTQTMRLVSTLLKPGGIVYVQTGDVDQAFDYLGKYNSVMRVGVHRLLGKTGQTSMGQEPACNSIEDASSYEKVTAKPLCIPLIARKLQALIGVFDPLTWSYFSLEGHVSYFSPKTLSLLYRTCGLETIQLSHRLFPDLTMPVGRKLP